MPKISVGRIVSYHFSLNDERAHEFDINTPRHGEVYPLMITHVEEDEAGIARRVSGTMFPNNGGTAFISGVQESDGSVEGTWFWPVIVPEAPIEPPQEVNVETD